MNVKKCKKNIEQKLMQYVAGLVKAKNNKIIERTECNIYVYEFTADYNKLTIFENIKEFDAERYYADKLQEIYVSSESTIELRYINQQLSRTIIYKNNGTTKIIYWATDKFDDLKIQEFRNDQKVLEKVYHMFDNNTLTLDYEAKYENGKLICESIEDVEEFYSEYYQHDKTIKEDNTIKLYCKSYEDDECMYDEIFILNKHNERYENDKIIYTPAA